MLYPIHTWVNVSTCIPKRINFAIYPFKGCLSSFFLYIVDKLYKWNEVDVVDFIHILGRNRLSAKNTWLYKTYNIGGQQKNKTNIETKQIYSDKQSKWNKK